MKRNKLILIALAFSLIQCNSGESNKQAEEQHGQRHQSEHGNGEHQSADFRKVHLTEEKLASLELKYDSLQQMTLKSNVKANGRMTIAPDEQAKISSLIGGRVKKINVIEGDYVEKGAVLALLEGTKITHMQHKYLEKKENLPYLKKEYERKQRLLEEEVGAAQAYQKAKAEYQSTKAAVQSLEQNLKMLNIFNNVQEGKVVPAVPVLAPFSGHIGDVEISRGEFVDPKQFLMEVMNTDQVHIDLDVYEKDIGKVREGQTVLFSYANQPGPWIKGELFKVGRKYHQENQSIKVHVEINEPEKVRLMPGVYVNAKIQAEAGKSYVLPSDAVIRDGNKTYVFAPLAAVQDQMQEASMSASGQENGRKRFARIPVKTGASESGYTAIQFKTSVAKDIPFVTKGAYYLQAEMKKSVGGHHH